jgi:serine/threonine-protein kinase
LGLGVGRAGGTPPPVVTAPPPHSPRAPGIPGASEPAAPARPFPPVVAPGPALSPAANPRPANSVDPTFFGKASHAPAAAAPPAVAAGVRPINPRRNDLIGRVLNGRYQIDEKVGEGGFGSVFRGKQLATGREVALKILHPHNVGDATIVARFRREAEACSKLRNPHTVITYDFDETEDGVLYLVMELLTGRSLHHLQKEQGVLAPDRVLRLIDQVADALGEAHTHGIIHRDMKPENVFIETREGEDYVKVLDFGIAKMISGDKGASPQALTAVGQTLGTLEFMSPEQLRGLALDGRSDIYALGIMAYEMLTGELPFKDAKTPVQIINFHMQKPAPAPSRLRPDLVIPGYVDEIILKMVAKERDDRYADTHALRDHIHRVLARHPSQPVPTGLGNRLKDPRVAGALAFGVVLLGTLIALLVRH